MLNEIDLSRVDLNLLVLFEAVLVERHVGRAADRLKLTPSAVSHGLGRLRQQLNDPLFLRTPKGVVPTARATQLSEPIVDVLARVRRVVSSAVPFDPATSARRFTIGAPDGVSAVFLPALLAELRRDSPSVDISVRQLLPVAGEAAPERAWRSAWSELESRAMDVAVVPTDRVPLRFSRCVLYDEDFVLAMRRGHPLASDPSLKRYCASRHLVVSLEGDPNGFVDDALAAEGHARRVALTVPNFMFALALLSDTDLVCAMPRRFAAAYSSRFDVVTREAPFPIARFELNIVAQESAMLDAGVAWLVGRLAAAGARTGKRAPRRPRSVTDRRPGK